MIGLVAGRLAWVIYTPGSSQGGDTSSEVIHTLNVQLLDLCSDHVGAYLEMTGSDFGSQVAVHECAKFKQSFSTNTL